MRPPRRFDYEGYYERPGTEWGGGPPQWTAPLADEPDIWVTTENIRGGRLDALHMMWLILAVAFIVGFSTALVILILGLAAGPSPADVPVMPHTGITNATP